MLQLQLGLLLFALCSVDGALGGFALAVITAMAIFAVKVEAIGVPWMVIEVCCGGR
jgi:hypothetical protein